MPYAKHHYKEKQKERTHKRRLQLLQGKNCIECGFSDIRALQFHHRNPEEKVSHVSQMFTWGIDKLMKEVDKCDILCANCHAIKHSAILTGESSNGKALGC